MSSSIKGQNDQVCNSEGCLVLSSQFAANHHGVRTSPLLAWRRTLAPPRLAAPPPPAGAGEAAGLKPSNTDGHLHHHQRVTPPPSCTPPPLLGLTALYEVHCRSSPPAPPPPPLQGLQAGLAGWRETLLYLAAAPRLPRHRGRRPGWQAGGEPYPTWQPSYLHSCTHMGQRSERWRARHLFSRLETRLSRSIRALC
jgi:hypothetical protein